MKLKANLLTGLRDGDYGFPEWQQSRAHQNLQDRERSGRDRAHLDLTEIWYECLK